MHFHETLKEAAKLNFCSLLSMPHLRRGNIVSVELVLKIDHITSNSIMSRAGNTGSALRFIFFVSNVVNAAVFQGDFLISGK